MSSISVPCAAEPATPKIPFVDLEAQIRRLKPSLMEALERVIDSRSFIKGRFVEQFEQDFAAAHGVKHAIGNANGTSAIAVALEASGIGAGDEVIIPAHTFIATAEAVCHVGAKPVFVDIDPNSYTVDPTAVEAAVTSRTRAVLPVHLYGTPADMDALGDVARRHNLVVIEDAAQSHLAEYGGRKCGNFGLAAAFSFYPGKNLGAFGDAGMVVTNDDNIALKVRKLSDHGRMTKYEHDVVGYNYRMDAMQGAVLSIKLPYLAADTARRQAAATRYDQRLQQAGFKGIKPVLGATSSVYHLYVIEVADRDEVQKQLALAGVETGVHYPVPLHLQPAFAALGGKRGQLPHAEAAADRVLSLPICGEISDRSIDYVCEQVLRVARPA